MNQENIPSPKTPNASTFSVEDSEAQAQDYSGSRQIQSRSDLPQSSPPHPNKTEKNPTVYSVLHEETQTEGESTVASESIESKKASPQQVKNKIWSALCSFLIMVLILAVSFITCLLFTAPYPDIETDLYPINEGLEYLYHNLKKDPILDLALINHTESCPVNFRMEKIGVWPGTIPGCKCPGEPVQNSSCDEISQGNCINIRHLYPIDLYDWQNSRFCVRRAIPGSEYVQQSVCPSGYQECSPGFCFLEILECPIYSLSTFEKDLGSVGTFTNGDSKRFLTPYRSGQSPLVDFSITPNGVPCFNAYETPEGLTEPYELLNGKDGCKSYGEDTVWSILVEEQAQSEILRNNQVEDSLISALPDYEVVIRNTQVLLSGRKRITVANREECLNLDKELFITRLRLEFERMEGALFWIKFIGFFSLTAIVFYFLTFKCSSQKDTREESLWLLFFFSGLTAVLLFFQLKKVYEPYSVLANAAHEFQIINENECFPIGQPRQILEDFSRVVDQIATPLYSYSMLLFLLYGCLAISSCVLTISIYVFTFCVRMVKQRGM